MWWVCCWEPCRQETSIDSNGAAAQRSAANAGSDLLTAELTRLNTDLFIFIFNWGNLCSLLMCKTLALVMRSCKFRIVRLQSNSLPDYSYWHCPCSMRSRIYETVGHLSVLLSVLSINICSWCTEHSGERTASMLWSQEEDQRKIVNDVVADVNASIGEKLKLARVLIHQLLSTTAARNWIDDCARKLVTTQRLLKCHQMAEQRRSRDETQFWFVTAGSCRFSILGVPN